MIKIVLASLLFGVLAHPAAFAAASSLHGFTVEDIHGKAVSLEAYRGKVVLIVNTASKCGFTKQYADLVALSKRYADKDFVVLGFPANDFGRQEPGSNREILEFCQGKFGVDFPMFSKVSVKGAEAAPLFVWLTSAPNPDFTGNIRWNFEKFLVGKDGTLLRRFRSSTDPDGDNLIAAIDAALAP